MIRRLPASARTAPSDATTEDEPDFDWSWTDEGPAWVAPAVDTSTPSVARIYDYALGGKDNYAVDRDTADRIAEVVPDARALARANREFVIRAVTAMAVAGIRQFVDLGCGIPTSPTVHETVRAVHPEARVVYVDNDPIVLAHTRAVLDNQPGLYAGLHDLREPTRVLRDPAIQSLVRLDEPVGLVLGGVLHYVDLTIGAQVLGHYLGKIAAGSQVAFSAGTCDGVPGEVIRQLERIFRDAGAPVAFRTTAQVEELIDGLELLAPGITDVTCWRTDGEPGVMRMHAGLALKR